MTKVDLLFELLAIAALIGCMYGFHRCLAYSWKASIVINAAIFFILRNLWDPVSVSFIMIIGFLFSDIWKRMKEFYHEWKDKKQKTF